jgi:glycosyltransferase involved in cell wall biosynthesis
VSIAEAYKISVLIIVKDEPEIAKTLKILKKQCEEMNTECIVVDASEHRLDYIKESNLWVDWFHFTQNTSKTTTIPQQRNYAVAKSKGDILVFCDAGGEPCDGWLKELIAPILEGKAKITGGPIRFLSKASPGFGYNNQKYGAEIEVPTTANMAFTRQVFNLSRGFDHDLQSGEDAGFVWNLHRNKITQFATPKAVMGLDNGTSRREITRAWRYGKVMSRLLAKFPEKIKIKQKTNPELLMYPVLVTLIISTLFAAIIDIEKAKILSILCAFIYISLAVKNRKSRRPWFGLLWKTIHAFSMCLETCRRKVFHRAKIGVMSYPVNDSRYLVELEKALTQAEFRYDAFYRPTGSATINLLLLPLTPLVMRLQGYRVLHIHWLFQFKLHWQVSRKWKYLMRQWFTFWIFIVKLFNIKIIWTVHELVPHEQVFDNDLLAAELLLINCSSLIALNKHSLEYLKLKNGENKVVLIPEGPLIMPTTIDKIEFRNLLNVAPTKRLIVLVGYLQPYKGVTALLEGAYSLPSTLAIRIAGRADGQYQKKLESILLKLKSQNIDIDIAFGSLTNDEYGGYLNAADFICVPFNQINNSGSINSALCAGVPVLIPNISSLNWVPSGARLDIPNKPEGNLNFKKLFQSLEQMSVSEHVAMRTAALNWASTLSWQEVAKQHVALYKEITGNND